MPILITPAVLLFKPLLSENHRKTGYFSGWKASLEKKRFQTLAEAFSAVEVGYPYEGLLVETLE